MGRAMDRLFEAQRREPEEPREWQAAARGGEYATWLTADELQEVNEAIEAVLRRHLDRLTEADAAAGGVAAVRVRVLGRPDVPARSRAHA